MGAHGHHSLALIGPAGDLASPVHGLDPRAKLLGLLAVTLVAISTPLAAWPVYVLCLTVLAAVAALARLSPRDLGLRLRLLLPIVLVTGLLLPFAGGPGDGAELALGPLTVHASGLATFAAVSAKATIGTLAAIVLGATSTFPQLLRGLEALRAPRLLVLIAALMHRYMFVIVAEGARMRAALAARGHRPRDALHVGALGRVATALFLRSFARGERVHAAMLARGFDGRMPWPAPLALRRADVAFVAVVLTVLVPARVAGGVL